MGNENEYSIFYLADEYCPYIEVESLISVARHIG